MDRELTEIETRVLGSLMEKEAATPEHYPLTLNALVNACNQKSNRQPVMALDESAVSAALDSLRAEGLIREISGVGHRVRKYGQRLGEVFNFDRREQAVLCVLMLRGPQTAGELRSRTERLYSFDELAGVEAVLHRLMERTPPLATPLPRRPGEREARHAHLLAGEVDVEAIAAPARVTASPGLAQRVEALERELAALRNDFEEFRRAFE